MVWTGNCCYCIESYDKNTWADGGYRKTTPPDEGGIYKATKEAWIHFRAGMTLTNEV